MFVYLGEGTVTAAKRPRDVDKVLDEFRDIVRDANTPPGRPPVFFLKPGAEPIARPMYRISQLERAELERQLKEDLKLGLMEPSSSPWSAPVLSHSENGFLLSSDLIVGLPCFDTYAFHKLHKSTNV